MMSPTYNVLRNKKRSKLFMSILLFLFGVLLLCQYFTFITFSINRNFKHTQHEIQHCKQNDRTKSQPRHYSDLNIEQELLIRRSKKNLVELIDTFKNQLEGMFKQESLLPEASVKKFKADYLSQLRAALIDAEDLYSLNEKKRRMEMKNLQDMIQSNIRHLQNPVDCQRAKKFLCNIARRPCGFGCQMIHLLYCALYAYGMQRTFVLESSTWQYNKGGWEEIFLPLSETCTNVTGPLHQFRDREEAEHFQNVEFPKTDDFYLGPLLPFRPHAFPQDISERLIRLHGDPRVWWLGQFIHYLLRPQPWLKKKIADNQKTLGFQTPCVGFHVRRTDKLGEAIYHEIEEYMEHAITWYDKLDLRLSKEKNGTKAIRRIYVATDDASVIQEAKKKYPDYVIFGDEAIAKSAKVESRYSRESLIGLLTNYFTLAECDFIICTLSSQICRLLHVIRQTLHPDASDTVYSLDLAFGVSGMYEHKQRAIYPHQGSNDELSFEVGDEILLKGDIHNGYVKSNGTNLRTMQQGLIPSYKVEDILCIINDYPKFKQKNKT